MTSIAVLLLILSIIFFLWNLYLRIFAGEPKNDPRGKELYIAELALQVIGFVISVTTYLFAFYIDSYHVSESLINAMLVVGMIAAVSVFAQGRYGIK